MVVTVKCDTVCMKYCDILNITVGKMRYHIETTLKWYDPRPISREHPSITQSNIPGFSLAMELWEDKISHIMRILALRICKKQRGTSAELLHRLISPFVFRSLHQYNISSHKPEISGVYSGNYFFIFCFTDLICNKLGLEDEIKMKIKLVQTIF